MSNVSHLATVSTQKIVDEFMVQNEELFERLLADYPQLARVPVALLRDAYGLLTDKSEENKNFIYLGGPFRLDYTIRTVEEDGLLRMELFDAGYRLHLIGGGGVSKSYDESPEMKEKRLALDPFLILTVHWRGKLPPFSERLSDQLFYELALKLYGPDNPTPLLFGIAYLMDSHLSGSRLNLGTRRTMWRYDQEKNRLETMFGDRRVDYAVIIDFNVIQKCEDEIAARHQ